MPFEGFFLSREAKQIRDKLLSTAKALQDGSFSDEQRQRALSRMYEDVEESLGPGHKDVMNVYNILVRHSKPRS